MVESTPTVCLSRERSGRGGLGPPQPNPPTSGWGRRERKALIFLSGRKKAEGGGRGRTDRNVIGASSEVLMRVRRLRGIFPGSELYRMFHHKAG